MSLAFLTIQNPLVICNVDTIEISDFAHHYNLFRRYWTHGESIPYESEAQISSLRELCPLSSADQAIPIGLSPVSLLLVFPVKFLPSGSLHLAYLLWISGSFVVVFAALRRALHETACSLGLPAALIALVFLSPLVADAVSLGQFSLLGVGMLLWIFNLQNSANRLSSGRANFLSCLALLVLSMKPTYFILGSILLATSRFGLREFACILLIAALSYLVVPIALETTHYYDVLLGYLFPRSDPTTTSSFLYFNQSTLAGAARSTVAGTVAVSSVLGFAAFSAAIRTFRLVSEDNGWPERKNYIVSLALLVSVVSPYWGAYDDLIFLLSPVVVQSSKASRHWLVLIWILTFTILFAAHEPMVRLLSKCLVILLLVSLRVPSSQPTGVRIVNL